LLYLKLNRYIFKVWQKSEKSVWGDAISAIAIILCYSLDVKQIAIALIVPLRMQRVLLQSRIATKNRPNESWCVDKKIYKLPENSACTQAKTSHGESASTMEEYRDNWSVIQKNSWFDTIAFTPLIWKIVIITLGII